MKIVVCETSDTDFWRDWFETVKPEVENLDCLDCVVSLPEMPACSWLAKYPEFDEEIWNEALRSHDDFINLVGFKVVSTRPTEQRLNQAFLFDGKYIPIRSKYYMPDEEGFYERRWFKKGDRKAKVVEWKGIKLGAIVCSEVFFQELARDYAKLGVHVIFVPRATQVVRRWLVALKMTAITSGAFVVSANRYGNGFTGRSWVISPEGEVLASTSKKRKVVSVDIDVGEAEKAKRSYPRTLYCVS